MQQQPLPTPTIPAIKAERIGAIISITMTDAERHTFDAFVELIKAIQKDRPTNEITYFMYDFVRLGSAFQSPYGRAKINELIKWRPELVSYVALILQRGFVAQIGRLLVNKFGRANASTYICFSRDEALPWLERQIARHGYTVDKTAVDEAARK